MISTRTTTILLFLVTILLIVIGLLLKPIPQPEAYHDFADQRSWFGLASAWDVLSNIIFAVAGIWGLYLLFFPGRLQFIDDRERWPWVGVSVGLILTAIGSGYYHLNPDNARLVLDRLPMMIVFMSYVVALFCERINTRIGLLLWPVLLVIAFSSVLMWHEHELKGISDLRFYLGMQEFSILVTLVILLSPSHYNHNWDLLVVVMFYGLAIICELYDHQIYMLSGNIISGHTLKHFSAGLASIWLIRMLAKRKIIHD